MSDLQTSVSEWIEHDGGPCPVDAGSAVDVRFASGRVSTPRGTTARFYQIGKDWWRHECDDPNYNIVAYRVVRP